MCHFFYNDNLLSLFFQDLAMWALEHLQGASKDVHQKIEQGIFYYMIFHMYPELFPFAI